MKSDEIQQIHLNQSRNEVTQNSFDICKLLIVAYLTEPTLYQLVLLQFKIENYGWR